MNDIIDKYSTHSKNLGKSNQQPPIDLNVEQSKYSGLNEQLAEASRGLRQMRGEELEGLSVDELHQMERKLEAGLHRVLSTKDQLFMEQINELQQKGAQLEGENMRLKKQVTNQYAFVRTSIYPVAAKSTFIYPFILGCRCLRCQRLAQR
ncbi:hypothetical protein SEVIR_4G075400v4 [Setaria viridis]